MEYCVVHKLSEDSLVAEVNKLIAGGWAPQGGVSYIRATATQYEDWIQAMVRTSKGGSKK